MRDSSGPDPIGELLDYAKIHASAGQDDQDPERGESFGALAARFFAEHSAPRRIAETETASDAVKRLEQKLPEEFPRLGNDEALISLLYGLGDEQARKALRRQLFRHPLVTESPELTTPPLLLPATSFEGRRFVSVDDHP